MYEGDYLGFTKMIVKDLIKSTIAFFHLGDSGKSHDDDLIKIKITFFFH